MSVTRRSILWGVPTVTVVATSPAFATSVPVCNTVRIRKVQATKKSSGYVEVNVTFSQGAVADINVTVDGVIATLVSSTLFRTSTKIKNKNPLIVITDKCGRVVWSGRLGKDC